MAIVKDCAFCAIASGQAQGDIVYQDKLSIVFLDKRPLFPGHCLLVPRQHIPTLADLPDDLLKPLFRTARVLSRAVEEAMEAQGSFVAMNNRVSQSVPHLHIHIVPRRPKDGLKGFFWPRRPYRDDEHRHRTCLKLREAVERALSD